MDHSLYLILWWYKIGVLPQCSRVNIVVWLHHEDFKENMEKNLNVNYIKEMTSGSSTLQNNGFWLQDLVVAASEHGTNA